jgi:hypothetical protein
MRRALMAPSVALILFAFSDVATGQQGLKHGARVYVAPMAGTLDACFRLGFSRGLEQARPSSSLLVEYDRRSPIGIQLLRDEPADYVLTSTSIKPGDPWYNTVFDAQGRHGHIVLIRKADRKVVWSWGWGERTLFWEAVKKQAPIEIGRRLAEDFVRELMPRYEL